MSERGRVHGEAEWAQHDVPQAGGAATVIPPQGYRVRAGSLGWLRNIFVYGQQVRLPDERLQLVKSPLAMLLKILGFVLLAVGLHWGPPYAACRHMKEKGMFYFGTTIATCTRDYAEKGGTFALISDAYDGLARRLFRGS